MVVACVTLRLSLRKGIYVGHIQWDIMSKSPTAWANLYGLSLYDRSEERREDLRQS